MTRSKMQSPSWTISGAIDAGITAAFCGSKGWVLFSCMAHHLPNIWPGQERLSEMSGLCIRAVKRESVRMAKAGLITRARRYRRDGTRAADHIKITDFTDPDRLKQILVGMAEVYAKPKLVKCRNLHQGRVGAKGQNVHLPSTTLGQSPSADNGGGSMEVKHGKQASNAAARVLEEGLDDF